MNTLRDTLAFVRAASIAATIQGHGSKADFLADRITQAATCETLLAFSERLTRLLASDAGNIAGCTVSAMISAASAPDAQAVLAWLRKYPKLAGMVCFLPHDYFEPTVATLAPDVAACSSDDVAPTRPAFEYGITCTLDAPLAHGSDTKAGNATLFRRQTVCGVNGGVMQLPFFAGNALRGILRDILADELTRLIGLAADRASPPYALWFFHALYAGGALEENKATKPAAKRTGDNGSIRAEGIREFRDMLPSLSLLGCAFGNRIICGRVRVADLRPRCKEWGTGSARAESLFDWCFLTRRDDHEGRSAEDGNKSMIANTEVLRPGTVLDGGIDEDGHASELEKAALRHALTIFASRGYLGAESRRGFGKCSITLTMPESSTSWSSWVMEHRAEILAYLDAINALAKKD